MISSLRNVALKREYLFTSSSSIICSIGVVYLALDMVVQPGNVSHDMAEAKGLHEFKIGLCYGMRLCLKKWKNKQTNHRMLMARGWQDLLHQQNKNLSNKMLHSVFNKVYSDSWRERGRHMLYM